MSNDWFTIWLVVARAVHFAACALILGTWAFDRLIVVREAEADWQPIARRLAMIALPCALFSGAAWFALLTIKMSALATGQALQPHVLALVWEKTFFGHVWQLRCVFWLLACIASAVAVFTRRQSLRTASAWTSLLFAALLLGSLACAGHGRTGPLRTLHVLADALHLLVTALWPVGLLPLAWLLWAIRRMPATQKRPIVVAIVGRFAITSLVSVALLTATGLVNAWCLVGSISNLVGTTYGRVLLAKMAVFCAMVALGGANAWRVKPRLASDDAATRQLRFNVWVELALATIVIAVVAILGLVPPAVE